MKKIFSFILSLLLLLSSTGITYAQHYCGDFVMMEKITFSEEALSCGMSMTEDDCGDESEITHDCCDNQYTTVSTDDNFSQASFDVVLNDVFVASFVSVFILGDTTVANQELPQYSEYNPPPLLKDIPVLYETFLI